MNKELKKDFFDGKIAIHVTNEVQQQIIVLKAIKKVEKLNDFDNNLLAFKEHPYFVITNFNNVTALNCSNNKEACINCGYSISEFEDVFNYELKEVQNAKD